MAILESVKKLASKVGAETNGRTIAEQINNINRHLDSTGSRDIAEAVSKFADVDIPNSGTFYVERKDREWISGSQIARLFLYDEGDGSCLIPSNITGDVIIMSPIKRINFSGNATVHIAFTPHEDFDGLYIGDNKQTVVGDEVMPGDGKVYDLYIPSMGNKKYTKYDIDFSCTFVFKSI